MPKKYYKKKRRYRKKRRYTKKKVNNITERKSLLPNRFRVVLPYGTQRTLSTTLGVATSVFSTNGLWDPDITGIGHQPRGFDEFMLMYNSYTGIGLSAELIFENETTNDGHIVGAYVTDSAGSFTSVDDIIENANVFYKKVEGQSDGGPSIVTVRLSVAPHKFLSISDPLDNSDIKGDSTSNPTKQVFLHVFAYPINSSASGGNIRFQAKLKYITILSDPNLPPAS